MGKGKLVLGALTWYLGHKWHNYRRWLYESSKGMLHVNQDVYPRMANNGPLVGFKPQENEI